MTTGTLYIVATPIGNLDDLSPRARRILAEVDVIAAEDTRHTARLLAHFSISTRQIALHDHNEVRAAGPLIERLQNGSSIALVSDAGTPLVSDPGFRLVGAAHEAGITVSPIPGASAAIAAMSVAGLPSDRFTFEGFLPPKQAARRNTLQAISHESRTLVYYESVHRISDSLRDMVAILGADRQAFIGREITKRHEQCVQATLGELAASLGSGEIVSKGEFVIVVAGKAASTEEIEMIAADRLLEELLEHVPGSQAADIVAKLSGRKRNAIYKEMLALMEARRD